jgi:hypothetical protein
MSGAFVLDHHGDGDKVTTVQRERLHAKRGNQRALIAGFSHIQFSASWKAWTAYARPVAYSSHRRRAIGESCG